MRLPISGSEPDPRRIEGIRLPGREGTFRIELQDGRIKSIEPSGEAVASCDWIAVPGLVNLHAHADRAFTAGRERSSSLADAIEMSSRARAAFTVEDVRRRAERLFHRSVAHGVTRIRTHTDVDPLVAMRSMEGLAQARAAVADRLDVEVIAFSTAKNDLLAPDGAARLRDAVALGADLIGAGLNFSSDPRRALGVLLDLAEASGLPVDIHLDEHLAPERSLTRHLVDAVVARGLEGRVTLSHGCILAALDPDEAMRLIAGLARARITVIALPETNLFLQDRGVGTPRRRGITLVRELLAAGVTVRFGTDNVRDWFYPFGDGDMLDTALIATIGAHLDDEAALLAGLCDGRAALQPGEAADLVLIPAESLDDALARRPAGRITVKAGMVVARPGPADPHP